MNIYKITNQITGDFYIGKTIQPVPVRFNTHKRNAQKNTNTRFYRAIRKYGISNFVIEVVETCNCEKY